MLPRLLDAATEQRVADVRTVLDELRTTLAGVPASPDELRTLDAAVTQLDDLFLLVIVGEFNAGKSAFVNALIGERLLEEGVTPTTAQIHLLRFGETRATRVAASGVRVVTAPVDLLRDLHIVDTPGTNAIIREHEQLTADFVPRSDLVLFVTSADRPFTESERAFLETIRDWGKKIVIVVNKVDILEREADRVEVQRFVSEAASRLLGVTPEIFLVSARLALRGREGDAAALEASRFASLERYVHDTLDERERFALKLANPLGVGDALARRYLASAGERLGLLGADIAALDDVERQLSLYREDLARGFELRMTAVEKVLLEMEARGHRFFEDTLRIGRVIDLFNRARVQREFEEEVVADAPQQVERRVAELIDWLVDQDFRQWQAVTSRLSARRRDHGDQVMGETESASFLAERARLLDSVGREAQRVVETYDRRRESQAIADGARNAVAATAAIGAGALGLGAAVTAAATTAAADVTGMLMAGVLAAVGLLIIPARRRRARTQMREQVSTLRGKLVTALRQEFAGAQERSAQRLADAVAPYARFVRAEQGRWTTIRTQLTDLRGRIAALRA